MPRYEIIYSPKSPALHVDLETEVEADFHRVEGRFVTFYARQTEYDPGTVVLRVAAAQVLQVKTLPKSDS